MRISDWSSDVCSSDLTMLVANNTDRTTGMPIAYTTQNATRAPSQTIAPIAVQVLFSPATWTIRIAAAAMGNVSRKRSEEHTSELQSLMRISYAVFCLKKKKQIY